MLKDVKKMIQGHYNPGYVASIETPLEIERDVVEQIKRNGKLENAN